MAGKMRNLEKAFLGERLAMAAADTQTPPKESTL
jgi:hypothetical protein